MEDLGNTTLDSTTDHEHLDKYIIILCVIIIVVSFLTVGISLNFTGFLVIFSVIFPGNESRKCCCSAYVYVGNVSKDS